MKNPDIPTNSTSGEGGTVSTGARSGVGVHSHGHSGGSGSGRWSDQDKSGKCTMMGAGIKSRHGLPGFDTFGLQHMLQNSNGKELAESGQRVSRGRHSNTEEIRLRA